MQSSHVSEHGRPDVPLAGRDEKAPVDPEQATPSPEQAPSGGSSSPAGGAARAAELAEMEQRYLRTAADLENYRKRASREIDRRVAQRSEEMLSEWLNVLDSVERALVTSADEQASEGFRAVLAQMEAILARHGVRRVGEVGEPFDPERHEALIVRPADGAPDRTVLEVARSGFAVDDRVLRPAQVVVSRSEG
jgi:molecular chaperone GrpE